MRPEFLIHNTHWKNKNTFQMQDPHLTRLKGGTYVFHSRLLDELPHDIPGIYSIGGCRQVGKTTLLKQWILKLLDKNIASKNILFLTGELIPDHFSLLSLLQGYLEQQSHPGLRYILIDEVTYIKDWDKAIKFAADAALLQDVVLVVTGSDLVLMNEARMRFPGRRGLADKVDFHLYPLSFREFVQLTEKKFKAKIQFEKLELSEQKETLKLLYLKFKDFLIHGGFLTAINDYAKNKSIHVSTLTTYSDWIRGDILKRGKQEHYLQEIIKAIFKRYSSQITWQSLAKDLSIEHHQTVSDYIHLLAQMDAVFIQPALLEDKLVAAPKKARKLHFCDPFIFHALNVWVNPNLKPFETQILNQITSPVLSSQLVESCVVTHFRRFYPTFYIKAEGEVDIAYIKNNVFWPVEIKWTNQLKSADLKQIKKYKNGVIYAKVDYIGNLMELPVCPIPLALYNLHNLTK